MTPRPLWRVNPEDIVRLRAQAGAALTEAKDDQFDAVVAPLVEAVLTLTNIVEGQGEAIRQLRRHKADTTSLGLFS